VSRLIVSIPAIMAVALLVGSPFCFAFSGAAPHGGLSCYCCSVVKADCPMICCPKCCMDTSQDSFFWSPDLVLSCIDLIIVFAWPLTGHAKRFVPPETVYLEVPLKPPIAL
jgi:hypothetical protein